MVQSAVTFVNRLGALWIPLLTNDDDDVDRVQWRENGENWENTTRRSVDDDDRRRRWFCHSSLGWMCNVLSTCRFVRVQCADTQKHSNIWQNTWTKYERISRFFSCVLPIARTTLAFSSRSAFCVCRHRHCCCWVNSLSRLLCVCLRCVQESMAFRAPLHCRGEIRNADGSSTFQASVSTESYCSCRAFNSMRKSFDFSLVVKWIRCGSGRSSKSKRWMSVNNSTTGRNKNEWKEFPAH